MEPNLEKPRKKARKKNEQAALEDVLKQAEHLMVLVSKVEAKGIVYMLTCEHEDIKHLPYYGQALRYNVGYDDLLEKRFAEHKTKASNDAKQTERNLSWALQNYPEEQHEWEKGILHRFCGPFREVEEQLNELEKRCISKSGLNNTLNQDSGGTKRGNLARQYQGESLREYLERLARSGTLKTIQALENDFLAYLKKFQQWMFSDQTVITDFFANK